MHPNDGRVVVQSLTGATITLYGDGTHTRAFCYVEDLIDGFVKLMAAPDTITGPINLGKPVETSIAELCRLLIELTGSRSKIVPSPINDPVQRCPGITEAERMLGWRPETPSQTASRAQSPISTGSSAKTKNSGARGNKR